MEEALNKALDLGMEGLTLELLEEYDVFITREHSQSVLQQIRHNLKERIMNDFQEVCEHKKLAEKLERLERMEKDHELGIREEKTGTPKEMVTNAIITAKREEVERLKEVLAQLEKEKEELKPVVVDNSRMAQQVEQMAIDQSKLLDETLQPTQAWMQTDAASWSVKPAFS
eukprot:CAMPEP_0201515236 /NCGR_PEP_ID=MMETSP0161_2-20130828/6870_1 /ASSEMBLY_ACC=CAM_ASM_000251 /TAXON_ID=180227 /ORGANISM="Neoparamoeba aestuarina, Strain SoJaBio B1-5/56/2" /LENGTH=170 /DNA_ID=CAMNT_0047912017 /DNA_START=6 /DNA_END=518 /DNA_ORIENTATION=-